MSLPDEESSLSSKLAGGVAEGAAGNPPKPPLEVSEAQAVPNDNHDAEQVGKTQTPATKLCTGEAVGEGADKCEATLNPPLRTRRSVTKDRIEVQKPNNIPRCTVCGEDVPVRERLDYRDRLRFVEWLSKHLSKLHDLVVQLFIEFFMWALVNIYFREVTVVNTESIPKTGAVVFYGNHQNQFIDALLIRANCGRPVRFIMAEKSFHRPIIGQFARMMHAVPVVRPQDVPLIPGEGSLTRMDGAIVHGEGTKFTTLLLDGDVIIWWKGTIKCTAQVLHVNSDTELELTMPVMPSNVVGQPTPFRISRRIDHSVMYTSVYETLQNGECIGIFPEGGSHDRTSLLPLKAGVALFSLGAAERGVSVKVVPCGLTYFYGHKFRSRAYLEFGDPITPSEELVALFSRDRRKATGIFLEHLNAELRGFTINVPNWSALNFLHGFRQLYQPPNCILATRDYLRLARRLSVIMEAEKDNPEFIDYRNRVENYRDYCNALLVRDSQAATLGKLGSIEAQQLQLLFRRSFTLFLMGVILVPFFVVCLPIGILASLLADRQRKKALSESTVKVMGVDVEGSYKLLVGFFSVPLVFTFVSLVTFFYTDLRTALTVFFSLPMAMYVSLLILQEAMMELRAALPLLMSVISKHKQFRKLYERRKALVALTNELVRKWDPELAEEVQTYVRESNCDMKRREPSLFSLRHSSLRRLADKNN
ncbi:glycerol-3-phosphate acyl transferase [Trypanosoma conorhini]|uniref:Glycerol-3-phosphate acyl transferase n=1 Tax=Trypanosoma conorhini TaxID=83891 RepID=A0A3S5ITK9_9TRYP|nr:glycerol-3-phosphate acyl transferase [Trypanosoma conorhini]RNF21916.1 glycerol-3-phosphate acyl transferase [Trypanosoma conorhini]